jgi:hypothetical protein
MVAARADLYQFMMRAIAGTSASDSLGENFLGFLRRAGLATGIHFVKILPQLIG